MNTRKIAACALLACAGAGGAQELPPEWQGYVHIQAAVSARTSQHAASEALISALQTPRAKSLFYANDQENQ